MEMRMSLDIRSGLATLPLLLSLLACGSGDGQVASFELTIRPVPPPSQADLFDDIGTLLVRVIDSSGAAEAYEIPVERGASPSIGDLGPLPEGAVIELEGYAGDSASGPVVARGHSTPLTVGLRETTSIDIFMAATGEMATFHELSAGTWGAAVVSDGEGDFWIMGGTDDNWTDAAVDAISGWQLMPPPSDFAPSIHTTFPTTADAWAGYTNEITGRLHHSATLLAEGSHGDVGKILVAGGWSGLQESRTVTAQLFLFDPAAEPNQAIEVLEDLKTGRAQHQAVGLPSGDVVFFGGYSHTDQNNTIDCPATVEVYSAAERESSYGSQMTEECMVDGAAAALGDDALHCGGVIWGSGSSQAVGDCVKVDRFANVTPIGGPASLGGAGLMLPAMATLDGAQVLLTGGVEVDGVLDDDDWQDASSRAFLYDGDNNTWQEVARMKVGRAGHVAASLPDGRVLVAGGAAQLRNRGFDWDQELPCAEIYNPDDNSWTLLDSTCAAGSDVGSLPTGLYRPSMAVDPYYGVLIWGGVQHAASGQPKAKPSYGLFVPELD
jgi:uncharacterized Zn-binding protein involved in type VI secretion